jgi:hypothetical protein
MFSMVLIEEMELEDINNYKKAKLFLEQYYPYVAQEMKNKTASILCLLANPSEMSLTFAGMIDRQGYKVYVRATVKNWCGPPSSKWIRYDSENIEVERPTVYFFTKEMSHEACIEYIGCEVISSYDS